MSRKDELIRLIKNKCEERIIDMFKKGIPGEVMERYNKEYQYMIDTDSVESLYIYHKLSCAANDANMPILISYDARCSFLTYLLGNSIINPLNAYYYCDNCGKYEHVEECYYGFEAKKNMP